MYALFQVTGASRAGGGAHRAGDRTRRCCRSRPLRQPVRRMVVGLLGGLEERLPPTRIVTA